MGAVRGAFIVQAVAGVAVALAAPGVEAREAATVRGGAALDTSFCEDFSVGDYDGRSCKGTVTGGFHLDARLWRLLVEVHASAGLGFDTDSEGVHATLEATSAGAFAPGPAPSRFFGFGVFAGAGLALPLKSGELRIALGPSLSGHHLLDETVTRFVDEYHVIPTAVGALALHAMLSLTIEAEAGSGARLGFHLLLDSGNEVELAWYEEGGGITPEQQAAAEANFAATELGLRPTFVLSVPGEGEAAVHLEVGPWFHGAVFGAEDAEGYFSAFGEPARNRFDPPSFYFALSFEGRAGTRK